MFLIQIAVTAAVVAFISNEMAKAVFSNPINALGILSGRVAPPMWTLRIRFVAFWSAIIFGLAGVWSL